MYSNPLAQSQMDCVLDTLEPGEERTLVFEAEWTDTAPDDVTGQARLSASNTEADLSSSWQISRATLEG